MTGNCNDTIAGIATPFGYGGIGIIRVSGRNSRDIASKLFRHKLSKEHISNEPSLQSHRLTHGYIFGNQNLPLDEVFCVIMEAPNSYTCEDVLEIQCHSGPTVLKKILRLVLDCGARLAEAGEFTRRALLNGRIDLSQAEAVIDTINAKTETGLLMAARAMGGQMREFVDALKQKLDEFIVVLQAGIEFGDELPDEKELCIKAEELKSGVIVPLEKICANYEVGRQYCEGFKLGIIGRPNVGKSCLLNCLLGQDKAIVSPYPGTTRDLVEDYFHIGGIPVTITDTAGLHLPQDPVEVIGVKKTREYLQRSDMVLLVTDAEQPFNVQDAAILSEIPAQPIIIVLNKIDLIPSCRSIDVPQVFRQYPLVCVSALHGKGIDELKKVLAEEGLPKVSELDNESFIPNLRQKTNMENALGDAKRALRGIECMRSEEFIVQDLISTREWLGGLVGENLETAILDQVFERFCIGK